MSLAEARTKARQMMGEGAPDAPVAFKALVDDFLEHARTKKGRQLRQNTLDQYRRAFKLYAAPLNKRPVAEITRREVASAARRRRQEKRRADRGPGALACSLACSATPSR